MKISKITILLLLSLLAACSDSDETVQEPTLSDTPILLTVQSDDVSTRGLSPMVKDTIYVMGVFAGYEKDDEYFGATSLANNYISNVRYTRSFLTDPFSGSDVAYWPFTGKLSFFAYCPYISSQNLQFASDYTAGFPRFSYTPTHDVTNQPDFCLAQPVLDQKKTDGAIPLHFLHTLSQLAFSANYSGDLPNSKLYVKIDSIGLSNVIGTKTVVVTGESPYFQWQDDATCTAESRTSYYLRRGGLPEQQHLNDVKLNLATDPVTDNYLNLTTANGRMYVIPQSMAYGDVYLHVYYGYYEDVSGYETARANISTKCKLPAVTWEPAHSYRYKFTIDLPTHSIVSTTVTVVAWQEGHNDSTTPQYME